MPLDPVSGGLAVGDDALKLATQVDAQKNTPAEVAAKQAQEIQKLKDQINAALASGNLDEIRRLCA